MERKIYVPKNSSRYADEDREPPSKPTNYQKKMKIVSNGNFHENTHDKPKNTKVKNSRIEPHLHTLQKYSSYEWDTLDVNDLYYEFKEMEKHLKSMVEADYKQCLHVVSDYSSLREYFLDVWERILFKDVGFACAKEIDKRLGVIIKKPIEMMSRENKEKKKHDEDSRDKLLKLIDSNIAVLKEIIQKLSQKLDLQNTPITEDNNIRKIASNLFSYLGELFQIREKAESSRPKLNVPVELYFRATSIYPYEGKYFMLVSNCSKMKDDLFGAVYWGIRAYCCTNYYPLNEQLLKYLEEARLAYLEMLEREWLDVTNKELFKYFVLSFLRYLNIILTKIGFEELYSVTNKMFEYLQKHINYLINEDSRVQKLNEGSLLQQTMMLLIYSLQNSIQGYNPRDEIKEKYLETQGKGFAALASNDLAKECLKDSYGVVFHILELVISIPDENYLNALTPLLYYLVGHKSISDYLLSTYKQLKDKMLTLNKKLNTIYKKKCEEMNITDEEVKTLLDEHSFASDKLLFGFVPLNPYFEKEKTAHKRPLAQDKQYIGKIKDTICNLDYLGCRVVERNGTTDEKEKVDIFNLEGIVGPNTDGVIDTQINAFTEMALNRENKEKNLIVLDGQNVAIRHGDTYFSSMGIKLAIDFWAERGHQVNVLLPDYYFKKEEVAMKKQLAQSKGESLKHIPDNVDILIELKSKGYAFGIPNWNYDDSYIIDYAKKKNAYIVTNDRYNDHIKNYSKNDQQKKEKLRDWIRNNCISFTFIGDDFMPNPDFLNEHMK